MLEFHKIESADEKHDLNECYIKSLVAPMDGMWQTIIANSDYRKITHNGQEVGYFCSDSDMRLLRLEIFNEFKNEAHFIFSMILDNWGITSAITSTVEPFYLSLCLDFQKQISINSYLFRDHKTIQASLSEFDDLVFRLADKRKLDELECFYRENVGGEGSWIRKFLEQRISLKELFVLIGNQTLLGTGECIVSRKHPPYADVGMVVSKAYRGKGIGTYLLSELKFYCESVDLEPICSCTKENIASRRAIQKAGFISGHRILDITF